MKKRQAQELLDFVRERGVVHPREIDAHFSQGRVTNWFGGSSKALTMMLEAMNYRGLLRVARREAETRLYAAHEHESIPLDDAARHARIDALIDIVVRTSAPLPATSLSGLIISRLRWGVAQWRGELRAAVVRSRKRLGHARVNGVNWHWPTEERLPHSAPDETVRLLTPFDPMVWDRRRFDLFWGWAYRFEAYTPAPKRKLGYYALPLLWRDEMIGWSNLSLAGGRLDATFGYVAGHPPRDAVFRRELDAEVGRIKTFVGV